MGRYIDSLEEIQLVATYMMTGRDLKETAYLSGRQRETVSKHLRKRGFETAKNVKGLEEIQVVANYMMTGNLKDAAELSDRDKDTVKRCLKRRKIPLREVPTRVDGRCSSSLTEEQERYVLSLFIIHEGNAKAAARKQHTLWDGTKVNFSANTILKYWRLNDFPVRSRGGANHVGKNRAA